MLHAFYREQQQERLLQAHINPTFLVATDTKHLHASSHKVTRIRLFPSTTVLQPLASRQQAGLLSKRSIVGHRRGSGGEGRGGDGHGGGGHGGGDGSHDGQQRRDRGSWYTSPVLLAAVTTVAVSAIVSRSSTVPNVPSTLGQIETAGEEAGPVDSFEEWFETALFSCRFFVLAAVLGSVAVSAMMFLKGSYEVWKSMTMFIRGNAHELTFKCIEAIDNYLTGTVLLIFGMGTYELFISKIDPAAKLNSSSNSRFSLDTKPRWLRIESLDDLKLKLGQVIVMIMLVNFFQQSKKMVLTEPLHLIFASGSTLLSSAAFSLSVWATHASHASHGRHHHHSTQHNSGDAH
eukprot:jgi/Chlat1/184/Chrsp1S08792